MAKDVLPPDSGGIIVRTVSEEVTREVLQKDFDRLHDRWRTIQSQARSQKAPAPVHRDATLISGIIRDLCSDKFEALRVDSKPIYDEVVEYVKSVDPDLLDRVHFHEGPVPLFDHYGVEEEVQQAFGSKVHLKSGGHIVIEPTEALVSIDVNTGKFT